MRIQLFHFLSVSAAALALCCACVEQIEPSGTLDGPQPLVFTAAQADMTLSTRAAADGAWDGDGTEFVAIKVGEEVKKYKVTSSAGALEPADGVAPFYRSDTGDIEVKAWYPYSASEPTAPSINTDQSTKDGREESNLMTASATAVFGETTTLAFSHQTALIKVSVTGEDGTAVTGATVTILGMVKAFEDSEGSYSALISPRTISSGAEFINITKDSKNYVYKLASETTFSAGNSYAYSLTLEAPGDYFWVEAAETVTGGITVSMTSSNGPTINLLYSTDGTNWKDFTVGSTEVPLSNVGDKVWFKAGSEADATKTNSCLATGSSKYNKFSFTGEVNVGGDITTLLSPDGDVSSLPAHAFRLLFSNCTALISAADLSLPATEIGNYCYKNMFSGCTKLTSAPKGLPVTTLGMECCFEMFSGCTKLTSAPELKATTLAEQCYAYMFKNCTSLETALSLPATTLVNCCYTGMFQGCTKLTSAPELPATTLASQCYQTMFQGCTKLTSAPELPATTLKGNCYGAMFSGCTNLTSAPELPAETLASSCYSNMFSGCTNLTSVTIKATTTATNAFKDWLSGVTSSGTIYYSDDATKALLTNASAIPTGWTVSQLTN